MSITKVPTSDSIIQEAIERFQFAALSEKDNRDAMKADMEFYTSDQWDSSIRTNRMGSQRPCLTINRLPQFTRQITNGLRQNMPSIRTIPVNDADEDVAKIFDGMMRQIQESSQAGIAYSSANNAQVICGLGFFRIITEYSNEKNFDKEIKIKRIKNPLSVYIDPAVTEPDYSDAQYMFITEDLTFEEFERRYPNKTKITADTLTGQGDPVRAWLTGDKNTMRIAEYFTIEEGKETTIYQLSDGSIVEELPEGIKEVAKRKIKERKIIWRIISALEVLETKPWDGKYIPIVPVIGEEIDVDGRRIIKGMVRDAIDPQRMYNYMISAQTEAIALAPKAPFIIAQGQLEGFKEIWAAANTQNYAYLPYIPVLNGGISVPPPQRQSIEPPIQAMTLAANQFSDDLKGVTGIYDAGLGARGNETSGKAINARKMQGDVSNYHYIDNFSYSQLHCGRIMIDLIPKTYDTARIVQCLGEDGSIEHKKINQPSGEKDLNGIEKIYNITQGEYNVIVNTGPSYKTKRQEDAELMAQMAQGNPELMKIAGDIIVRNMDLPGAQELSERIKKTLPPQLQDVDPSQEIPLPVKQQLDQSAQMIRQLTGELHKLQDEKDQKKMELESKERIALEQINGQITIESMKMEGSANHAVLLAELKGVNDRLSLLNVTQPVGMDDSQTTNVQQVNSQLDNGNNNGTINSDNTAGASPGGQ